MNYVRYPRAAVAVATPGKPAKTPTRTSSRQDAPASIVLWASIALPVRGGGQLVGVRRRSNSDVEVAWLRPGSPGIQWVAAGLVLTDQEAQHWLKVARFSRQ